MTDKQLLQETNRRKDTEKQREFLQNLLKDYIENFDNENISNKKLKRWLDDIWIPKVREVLADDNKNSSN